MTKKQLKYVNSLKEENERVKTLLLRFLDAAGKLTNIDDVVNMSLMPLMAEENKKFRAELKAEAYKEFAERLKGQCNCVGASLLANKIDNLLKEMESESNG